MSQGIIKFFNETKGFGFVKEIDSDTEHFVHVSGLIDRISEGDKVEQGSKIGLVGSTGRATGPHLHWSVSLNGFRVDPNILVQTLNNIIGADRVFYGG